MDERILDGPPMTPETPPEGTPLGEGLMVREEAWREVHRLFHVERQPKAAIARRLDLDRKTVRTILREPGWQPYRRAERGDTVLAQHIDYLRQRAPAVQYSARILFQESRQERQYRGSYETVKRFVRPLRGVEQAAERAAVRFETPPGRQSQIDWGQARVYFRSQPVTRHVFILTLGYSRRSFHEPCVGETLSQFLDAHERAFEHFGGHTREHLYDRPRTVCAPAGDGRVAWNATFKQFADYWGFEPHVCRPYRAQTKGKVESGVKCQRPPYSEPPGSGRLSHPGSPILSQAGSPILSHPGAAILSHPVGRDRIPSSISPSPEILREHTTLQEVTSGGTEESGDRHP